MNALGGFGSLSQKWFNGTIPTAVSLGTARYDDPARTVPDPEDPIPSARAARRP